MSWSLLSPILVVTGALVLIGLERLRPYEPGQRFLRDLLWMDFFGYTLIQSYVLTFVISGLIQFIDHQSGASSWALIRDWPLWVQVAFFVVTHDLYIYWFHRWQHYNDTLWRVHEAHHSTRDVDWIAGSRSHALEILINQTIEFAPMVLLGAHPEVPQIKLFISAVWGMYIHSNIDVRSGPLQYIINGPEMHRWHHATDLGPPGKNFATKLAVWDWVFGTAYLPKHQRPTGYGLDDEDFPTTFTGQFFAVFRPAKRS